MKEERKDVVGYEGLYQVSNLGNVISLFFGKKRLLKTYINARGYKKLMLWKNKTYKNYEIHRLVALTRIPLKKDRLCVNHIDRNPLNNSVENLERCNHSENNQHGYNMGRVGSNTGKFLCNSNHHTKVNQYNVDGKFIKTWDCILTASNKLNIQASGISACCRKVYKTSGGFHREYFTDITN